MENRNNMRDICYMNICFNYFCSRNCDRGKCYAYVVKGLIIKKRVVDSEKRLLRRV